MEGSITRKVLLEGSMVTRDPSYPQHSLLRGGTERDEKRGRKWQFLSTHMARKTFVTLSLERGMRPEVLLSFTGHRSFKTMKRYIAHTEKLKKEEMDRVWG
jgi:integrase